MILILQITMITQTKSQMYLVEQVSLDTKVDEYAFQTWEHHKWATRPNPHLNGMTYWEQSKQTRRAASRFGYHGRYDCGHIWPKNVISTNMMNSYYDGNKKICWDHCMKPQSQATFIMDNPHLLETYTGFRSLFLNATRQFGVTKNENEILKSQTNGRGKKFIIHCPLRYSYKEAEIDLWIKNPVGDGTWDDLLPMDNFIIVPDGYNEWESQFYSSKAKEVLNKYTN